MAFRVIRLFIVTLKYEVGDGHVGGVRLEMTDFMYEVRDGYVNYLV